MLAHKLDFYVVPAPLVKLWVFLTDYGDMLVKTIMARFAKCYCSIDIIIEHLFCYFISCIYQV